MAIPLYLTEDHVRELQYELTPVELKNYVTRLMRKHINSKTNVPNIILQNEVINRVSTIAGSAHYTLESDHLGSYEPQEEAWHASAFESCLSGLSSAEFVEFLAEALTDGWFTVDEINSALSRTNSSVKFLGKGRNGDHISVSVIPVAAIADGHDVHHPNVRKLIARLDQSLDAGDYPAVLHACASVFEVVAKEVVDNPAVAEKSLGSFFEAYRNASRLPADFLDYILEVYNRRNTEPLAGHGQLSEPTVTREEAVILASLTKAIVEAENRLRP